MKKFFCAPENPNEFFNRNLCRIAWANAHNWGHVAAGLALTYFYNWQVATGLLYGWEFMDGFKPHYSLAPLGSDIVSRLKRNLLYSDKFSLEDAFVFNPIGIIFGIILTRVYYEAFSV